MRERIIISNQTLNILQRSLQVNGERFEFVLVHPELMPAGFERGRATEPIVGVFYIEGIHGCALLVLFGYTVIEVRRPGEREATNCIILASVLAEIDFELGKESLEMQFLKVLLIITCAVLAWGCTSAQKITRPGGQVEYQIACGAGTGWNICYQRAEEECPNGYTTIKEDPGFSRKELRILCAAQ